MIKRTRGGRRVDCSFCRFFLVLHELSTSQLQDVAAQKYFELDRPMKCYTFLHGELSIPGNSDYNEDRSDQSSMICKEKDISVYFFGDLLNARGVF